MDLTNPHNILVPRGTNSLRTRPYWGEGRPFLLLAGKTYVMPGGFSIFARHTGDSCWGDRHGRQI